MLRWGAIVLLSATPALADGTGTVESERRAIALEETTERGFHAQAFAQVSGGATDEAEADAAVGAELRVVGPHCDYVRAGGQARLGWNRGTSASAEQWASACIPVRVMEFGHHLEWDVRPSLLAPLQLRAGTNRRETASFHWQPLRANPYQLMHSMHDPNNPRPATPLPDPLPPGDLVIFEVQTDWTFLWSATAPLSMMQTAEVFPFRYIRERVATWGERRDFVVDVGAGGGEFIQSGLDQRSAGAAAVHVWGVRIENLALGPVYASGGIGIASAEAGEFVTELEREVKVTRPRALLGLETGGQRAHGHLRATHDASAAPDGYVVVESRLASGVGVVASQTKIAIDAAIAQTDVRVPGAMRARASTGGVSLSVARRLNKHLQATALVEVARSFYAPATTTLDFTPRWGVQAFGALQATASR